MFPLKLLESPLTGQRHIVSIKPFMPHYYLTLEHLWKRYNSKHLRLIHDKVCTLAVGGFSFTQVLKGVQNKL